MSSERDVLEAWMHGTARPEVPRDVLGEGVDEWMGMLSDFNACEIAASRVLFDQPYGRDTITSALVDTINPLIESCRG